MKQKTYVLQPEIERDECEKREAMANFTIQKRHFCITLKPPLDYNNSFGGIDVVMNHQSQHIKALVYARAIFSLTSDQ